MEDKKFELLDSCLKKIKKNWYEIIKGDKLSRIERCKGKLEEVKKYVEKNNKMPSAYSKIEEVKKLGRFLSRQRQNYKQNKYIMKNQEMREEFQDFMNKYSNYFKSNEEQWREKLKEVKKYAKENNRLPSNGSKIEEVKKLGMFLSHQKRYYKQNKYIMKNQEMREEFEEFILNNDNLTKQLSVYEEVIKNSKNQS